MTNGIEGVDINQLAQMRQIEEIKRKVMSRILTKEAFERLSRVRSVNPMLANQVDLYLLQIYQAGRITQPVTEERLKEILNTLSEKRDFNIKRR